MSPWSRVQFVSSISSLQPGSLDREHKAPLEHLALQPRVCTNGPSRALIDLRRPESFPMDRTLAVSSMPSSQCLLQEAKPLHRTASLSRTPPLFLYWPSK